MLRKIFIVWIMVMAVGCAGMGNTAVKGEVPLMTKEELKGKLGASEVVILDVRAGRDWKAEEVKIAGAVREDPREFERWSGKYPKDKTLVLYCA